MRGMIYAAIINEDEILLSTIYSKSDNDAWRHCNGQERNHIKFKLQGVSDLTRNMYA
jgi:hypothetical protein